MEEKENEKYHKRNRKVNLNTEEISCVVFCVNCEQKTSTPNMEHSIRDHTLIEYVLVQSLVGNSPKQTL